MGFPQGGSGAIVTAIAPGTDATNTYALQAGPNSGATDVLMSSTVTATGEEALVDGHAQTGQAQAFLKAVAGAHNSTLTANALTTGAGILIQQDALGSGILLFNGVPSGTAGTGVLGIDVTNAQMYIFNGSVWKEFTRAA